MSYNITGAEESGTLQFYKDVFEAILSKDGVLVSQSQNSITMLKSHGAELKDLVDKLRKESILAE